jgi:SAM-dependent methyltransferase
LPEYAPREYWTRLAKEYAGADPTGFAPVLHPDTPAWFNERIDFLQARAWVKALESCQLAPSERVLDAGCGTGRWLRRLADRGLHPVGVDQSAAMLGLARTAGTACPLFTAELQKLPLRDGSFACVCAITVVQHIPDPEQISALKELARVARPGGYLILLELARGSGLHVFARSPSEWISQARAIGLRLVGCRGQEFLFLDRALVGAASLARRMRDRTKRAELPPGPAARASKSGLARTARTLYWGMRRMAVAVSLLFEPAAERALPVHFATHALMIFQKEKVNERR